jgi:hypothetical protein
MLFEKNGHELTYRTSIPIKPGAFEFLKSTHNDLPDLRVYHHMSANEGIIKTMHFDGREYKVAGAPKKIAANQFEKEIKPEKVTSTILK